MKQNGIIISINEDRAKVMLQRQTSCGDCKACKLGRDNPNIEVDAINSINAKIGDHVEIDMEHQSFLVAAFIVYMIPLFALIGGILIGNMMLDKFGMIEYKEVGSGLFGLLLTAITFVIIRLKEKSFKSDKRFVPVITGILHE
ncbi:MAG: SoxR reducing system RseC family protein [Natronincolaceae bacterium]|nr:SoxR reducing system RseC family protein [Bacillota bacterium]